MANSSVFVRAGKAALRRLPFLQPLAERALSQYRAFEGPRRLAIVQLAVFERVARHGGAGRLREADFSPIDQGGVPSGETWLDARLLARLGARVGDTVNIGASAFTVTRVLDYRPDQGSASMSGAFIVPRLRKVTRSSAASKSTR